MSERKHIAKRFVIHYFSAFGVWMMVLRFLGEPLSHADPGILAQVMATSFMMAVIAGREIFDANKLAKIRAHILKDYIADIEDKGELDQRSIMSLQDPRFTLKKSMWDLGGWGAGIATMIILL